MRRIALFLLLSAGIATAQLRLGRSAVDITPPAGTPMGGGFTIRLSTGVHDPLYCKALLFELSGERAAMVTCDLESLHRPTIVAARKLIDAGGEIAGARVMITATHSHSGPEMTPLVVDSAQGEAARLIGKFHADLPGHIAQAVKLAARNLTPVRVWTSAVEEHTVSFNRRYLMKDGSVQMNPGPRNPDIVRVAGPIDPELRVVYFDTPEKAEPVATAVNFALHTTAWGGPDFSSDFPGVLASLLANAKSQNMLTVFHQGCSGNINQVDVNAAGRQHGPEVSARIGTVLAAGVLKAYRSLMPVPAPKLLVRSATVPLAVPSYTDDEVRQAWDVVRKSREANRGGSKFLDIVHAFRVINVVETHKRQPIPAEVQVIALGDQLAWVGLPAEDFVELGFAIKRGSPFPVTIVNELANDMLDYIPNRRAFPEGSYEPTTARCAPGCGETLVDGAVQLLVDMYREAHGR